MTPDQVWILTLGAAVCGPLVTAIIALWRRVGEIDARADQLLAANGSLQAQVATFSAELERERQEKGELKVEVITLRSDLDEAREQIRTLTTANQRLTDENQIFRSAFEKQGINVASPGRRRSDRGARRLTEGEREDRRE